MVTIYSPLSKKQKDSKRYLTDTDLEEFLINTDCSVNTEENGPLFSIVIPSYNQAEYLEKTLKSILYQNYRNIEIIVMDGGSTDGTLLILEKYTQYIKYWESTKDKGQSDALNKGFSKATGEIFGWLNSDDIYLPGAIKTVAKIFNINSSADVVYGDIVTINDKDKIKAYHHTIPYNKYHLLYEGFTMNAQAMFWRAECHKKFGSFNLDLHRTMDYDMMVRFSKITPKMKFYRCNVFLAGFRRHSLQKTQGLDHNVQSELRTISQNAHIRFKGSAFGTIITIVFKIRRVCWNIRLLGFSMACREIIRIIKRKIIIIKNAI